MAKEENRHVTTEKKLSFLSITDILSKVSPSDKIHSQAAGISKKSCPSVEFSVASRENTQHGSNDAHSKTDLPSENKQPESESVYARGSTRSSPDIPRFWKYFQNLQQNSANFGHNIDSLNLHNNEHNEVLDLLTAYSRLVWESSFWPKSHIWHSLGWHHSQAILDKVQPQMCPINYQGQTYFNDKGRQTYGLLESGRDPPVHLNMSVTPRFFPLNKTETRGNHHRPPQSQPCLSLRLRRHRQAYTVSQLKALEDEFKTSHYLLSERRTMLSQTLGLTENQVKAWFQNRRTKYKKLKTLQQPTEPTRDVPFHTAETRQPGPTITEPSVPNGWNASLTYIYANTFLPIPPHALNHSATVTPIQIHNEMQGGLQPFLTLSKESTDTSLFGALDNNIK